MKVVLFTLGGTIASTPAAGGVVPRLSGADLLTSVPGLDRAGLEVKVHDFRQVPSSSLTIGDILDLAVAIREQVGAGADGVVVSQGTDTIEETVFLLDLLYDGDAPVVFTGAMRHPMLAGADGPANLLAAVTVAASPQARGLGCLVVFGDEIHAARFVRKAHTTSITAFISPPTGPLGGVGAGRPGGPAPPGPPAGAPGPPGGGATGGTTGRRGAGPGHQDRAGDHGPRRRRHAARRGRGPVRRAGGGGLRRRARTRGAGGPAG